MNDNKIYQILTECVSSFMNKDIIRQNLEIQKMQVILARKGYGNDKFTEIKEEAKKLAISSTRSYYDILKELTYNRM